MSIIVKVQRPVSGARSFVLVYDKRRRVQQVMDGSAVIPLMGDRLKVYFHAEIIDGFLVIADEAKEQEW